MALDHSPEFLRGPYPILFLAVPEKKNFEETFCVRKVKVAPIHQSHIYGPIKFSQTDFEKGHPRSIPMKLFQNLTSSFREEDILRISLYPYGASSPHLPDPYLLMDQNFTNIH